MSGWCFGINCTKREIIVNKNKKGFELKKPMNLVRCKWPRNMTRTDMKMIHLVMIELKRWMLNEDFKPDFDRDGIEAYSGIKTAFSIPVENFAKAIGSDKSSVTKLIKDENKETVYSNGFPLRRIVQYCRDAQNISVDIDSQYVSGGLTPIAAATYDERTQVVNLYTSELMAAILADKAFETNASFVDMQLQMTLKSLMAVHILDRISRFKTNGTDYSCTIKSLIDECGIDVKQEINRDNFIRANIRRPIEQIVKQSDGMWERIGSGFHVTRKEKGNRLSMNDIVTFKMKYNNPETIQKQSDTELNESDKEFLRFIEVMIQSDRMVSRVTHHNLYDYVLITLINNLTLDSKVLSLIKSLAVVDESDEVMTKHESALNLDDFVLMLGLTNAERYEDETKSPLQ